MCVIVSGAARSGLNPSWRKLVAFLLKLMSRRLQSSDERLRTALRHFSSLLTRRGVVNAKHPFVNTVKQRVTSTAVEAVRSVWAQTVQSAKFRQWSLYRNVSLLHVATRRNKVHQLKSLPGFEWGERMERTGKGPVVTCPKTVSLQSLKRWVKPQRYWVQDRRCPGQHLIRGKMRPCNVKAHAEYRPKCQPHPNTTTQNSDVGIYI